jgi:hydroxyacylglutathione hydrolase
MMYGSLQKIAALPSETLLYCGHEYTLANAKFGLTIEPENVALQRRTRDVEALRAAGAATLPTEVGLERETNVFLRPKVSAIRKRLGFNGEPDWKVFAEIRERKNKS